MKRLWSILFLFYFIWRGSTLLGCLVWVAAVMGGADGVVEDWRLGGS